MPLEESTRRKRNCVKSARYRANNLELVRRRRREYYWRHREERIAYSRKYRLDHPETKRLHGQRNRDKINEQCRKRYAANPEVYRQYRRKWSKNNRYKVNQVEQRYRAKNKSYHIKLLLGAQIWRVLRRKNIKQVESTMKLLGCDVSFFKQYIQDRFLPGMTWDNHGRGRGKWHIDHRIPCNCFDLTDKGQRAIAFHYSNLQPLWSEENLRKYTSVPSPHQAELI